MLTDDEIEFAAKTKGVSWTGYREDAFGFYTIPILSPYHYQFARAIEAAVLAKLQAQSEPVAWMGAYDNTDLYYRKPTQADVVPLYRHPAPVQQETNQVLENFDELKAQNKTLLEALKAIADYPELDALEMKREARAAIAQVEGK